VRIFVLTATDELRVSRKSHLRDHPTWRTPPASFSTHGSSPSSEPSPSSSYSPPPYSSSSSARTASPSSSTSFQVQREPLFGLFFSFYIRYSTLLHLPPLRYQYCRIVSEVAWIEPRKITTIYIQHCLSDTPNTRLGLIHHPSPLFWQHLIGVSVACFSVVLPPLF
jgi:hypothetical protein